MKNNARSLTRINKKRRSQNKFPVTVDEKEKSVRFTLYIEPRLLNQLKEIPNKQNRLSTNQLILFILDKGIKDIKENGMKSVWPEL